MGIRPATSADLDALLPLAEGYCRAEEIDFDPHRTHRALSTLLADPRLGRVLVVEAAGVVCGYAVLTWGFSIESGGVEALLDEVYVADRGLGHGTSLIRACIDLATEHGALALFLETESHNERARALYSRLGFSAQDSIWMSRHLH